jgi:hypothetical protein
MKVTVTDIESPTQEQSFLTTEYLNQNVYNETQIVCTSTFFSGEKIKLVHLIFKGVMLYKPF